MRLDITWKNHGACTAGLSDKVKLGKVGTKTCPWNCAVLQATRNSSAYSTVGDSVPRATDTQRKQQEHWFYLSCYRRREKENFRKYRHGTTKSSEGRTDLQVCSVRSRKQQGQPRRSCAGGIGFQRYVPCINVALMA